MNERIKELYKEAGLVMNNPMAYEQWYLDSLVKFAELIVKECMEQVWYSREDGINGNISEVIKERMKEHFGVEE
jgi:hypothetical protein